MPLSHLTRSLCVSLAALAVTAPLGGCLIIATDRHSWDADEWRESDRSDRPMVGVNTARVGKATAAQASADAAETTLISHVYKGSPADGAGLREYDVVVAINGKGKASPRDVREAVRSTPRGESLSFTIVREGARQELSITPQPASSVMRTRPSDF